ncbi:MAG TPA: universal stress protein [Saprospiraceae bacterium]|nr:universal stress protein [Saprospiraceae bacterium]HMQ84120.1 universal stress protein [Saprospiraceae bacterium]
MISIEKILFPTDFSPTAQNAFRYCLRLADHFKAKIQVLHVVYPEYEALDLPVLAAKATQDKLEAAKDLLKPFIELSLAQLSPFYEMQNRPDIQSGVEIGTPAALISEKAEDWDCDLIVMGTKGQHSLLEKFFGSVTSSVIEKSPCPVWVIPELANFHDVKSMAYASDLRDADPYHIWEIGKLLETFAPLVRCVHVNTEGSLDTALDFAQLGHFFEHHAPGLQITFHALSDNSVTKALEEFTAVHDIDLLVMYTPQRHWLENLFHKSRTKGMAFVTHIPLLILK